MMIVLEESRDGTTGTSNTFYRVNMSSEQILPDSPIRVILSTWETRYGIANPRHLYTG